MLVSEAIQKAYLHAQRKATAPAIGTSKYNALLAIADSMQKIWADEADVSWNSLYKRVNLTATVSATDTFSLASSVTIDTISNKSDDYILVTNGTNSTKYQLVNANQLYSKKDSQVCAKIGNSLVFAKPFAADSSLLGYNIEVPAYTEVPAITSANDTVAVDRPMWLAYMMAAEFVRNDVVRQNQYENLLALAEQVMDKMKDANGGSIEEVVMDWQPAGETW